MHAKFLIVGLLAFHLDGAEAECMYKGFREGDAPQNPVYQVLQCDLAKKVIDEFRKERPGWFGEISYSKDDMIVTVTYANEDAQRLMWQETEHWYSTKSCNNFQVGGLVKNVEKKELCCDVGPVQNVHCAAGGIQVIYYEISDAGT